MTKILKNYHVLAVPDAAVSSQFYTSVLGFHEVLDVGGWRFVQRDHCMFMLGECPDALPVAELGDHSYVAYLVVDNVDGYCEEILQQKIEVTSSIGDKPWGMREFGIRTPDGHRIMLGQDIATTVGQDAQPFTKTFEVRWADLDPNRHLRNTAFNDYATHLRFAYLEQSGFGAAEFARHDIGPVIFREEIRFFREVAMNETITVDYRLGGLSDDGSRFRLCHDVRRGDDALAATLTAEGGWMNLSQRKLAPPPPRLVELLQVLPKTDDFETLPRAKSAS